MDLLPTMFVMSCNRLQQFTELKLLVVMKQVLRCTCVKSVVTPLRTAAPTCTILHQWDYWSDYHHNRLCLLSSSSQLVKHPGETLIAKTLTASSWLWGKHIVTTHKLQCSAHGGREWSGPTTTLNIATTSLQWTTSIAVAFSRLFYPNCSVGLQWTNG